VLAPGWLDHFIFNEYYKICGCRRMISAKAARPLRPY